MNRTTTAAWILGLAAALGLHAEPAWLKDVDAARAAAAKEKKPIALLFADDGNRLSARLEAKLDDPEMKTVLSKFAAARIDLGTAATAEAKALASGYGVQKAPALVILNPEGKLLGLTGYQAPELLAKSIEEILKRTPRETQAPPMPGGPLAPGVPPGQAPAPGGEQNPLRPVAGSMEDVHADINRQDTGPVVHQKIKSILDELDRLIKQADSNSSSSSSSSSSQSQGKDQSQGEGEGEGEGKDGKGMGKGKPKGKKPGSQGAKMSASGDRGEGEHLNNPFAGPASAWGERVKIDPEKSAVLKAREGVTPPEYDSYVNEYFNRLARDESDR